MSKSGSYIDKCAEAVGLIDPEQLGSISLGDTIGTGSQCVMKGLGRISLGEEDLAVGLKMPRDSRSSLIEVRLHQELTNIELLLQHVPELAPEVPRFIGIVSIAGLEPTGLITEDASDGGKLQLWPRSGLMGASPLAKTIADAFAEIEGVRVDRETIDYSLAFNAGDQRRLLDFTPPPVWIEDRSVSETFSSRIYDLEEEGALTINISPDSALATSLAA